MVVVTSGKIGSPRQDLSGHPGTEAAGSPSTGVGADCCSVLRDSLGKIFFEGGGRQSLLVTGFSK